VSLHASLAAAVAAAVAGLLYYTCINRVAAAEAFCAALVVMRGCPGGFVDQSGFFLLHKPWTLATKSN
jgi:hypothetical protein